MPRCPTCGGTAAEAIAPGYFRCTTEVAETDSWGDTVRRRCGKEYHEGSDAVTGTPKCACGTFAIGQCQECNAAVCGDHSRLVDGRRLCAPHAGALEQEAERERLERRERARFDVRAAAKDAGPTPEQRRAQIENAQAAVVARFEAAQRDAVTLVGLLVRAGNPGLEIGKHFAAGRFRSRQRRIEGWTLVKAVPTLGGGSVPGVFCATDGSLLLGSSGDNPADREVRISGPLTPDMFGKSPALLHGRTLGEAIIAGMGRVVAQHGLVWPE